MTKKEWLYQLMTSVAFFDSMYSKENKIWQTREEIAEASQLAAKSGIIDSPILMRASQRENDRSIELYNLVREINEDDSYPIVIMQKNALFKAVMSKEEGIEYLNGTLRKRALTALKRYWQQYRKICKDGQFDLFAQEFIKGVAE